MVLPPMYSSSNKTQCFVSSPSVLYIPKFSFIFMLSVSLLRVYNVQLPSLLFLLLFGIWRHRMFSKVHESDVHITFIHFVSFLFSYNFSLPHSLLVMNNLKKLVLSCANMGNIIKFILCLGSNHQIRPLVSSRTNYFVAWVRFQSS